MGMTGHDLFALSARSATGYGSRPLNPFTSQGAECCALQSIEELFGRTYDVKREGHGHFTLTFLAAGRLIINIQGQDIEETWQPSSLSNLSNLAIVLGGNKMPAAGVVIGPRLPNVGSDPNELWEPSPPMGAPPLVGSWRRNGNTADKALATKIEIIVDRSGSMRPLHSATVQGLNQFLTEQRSLPRACTMTMRLVVFDHIVETCWAEGTPLTDTSYTVTPEMVQPRGQTALLDAIGGSLSGTPLTPPRIVCIVTDGCENSSQRYTRLQVNDLITARKNAGWTFIFLAANQDAISVGATLGIGAGTCATFSATSEGIAAGFGSASASCCRGSTFGSGAAAFSSAERAACLSGRTR